MLNTPKKTISCLKWDSDGELSIHDTHLLIKRLANSEKSRRTMLDHHELRRWRSRMNGNPIQFKTLSS
ncbi:MAG: hypothetical protein CBC48_01090 [bacterium TMED88]|nr:hypothetical protein [Deltaproteobacteria bacterium]OUV37140.1 MAG: hypothetical protein CBC48_01090 [bacterium TMED88]